MWPPPSLLSDPPKKSKPHGVSNRVKAAQHIAEPKCKRFLFLFFAYSTQLGSAVIFSMRPQVKDKKF